MLRSSWNDLKCLGGTLFQHLLLCSNMKAGEGRHRQKTFVSHCPGAGFAEEARRPRRRCRWWYTMLTEKLFSMMMTRYQSH